MRLLVEAGMFQNLGAIRIAMVLACRFQVGTDGLWKMFVMLVPTHDLQSL